MSRVNVLQGDCGIGAFASGAKGQRFESSRAYHSFQQSPLESNDRRRGLFLPADSKAEQKLFSWVIPGQSRGGSL